MSKPDFSQINDTSAKSFNVQRRIIKDLCMGKQVRCPKCNLLLEMVGPSKKLDAQVPGIYCKKGCTSIELAFDAE